MADFLYSIDLAILYFFNHTLSSPFADKFFSTITDVNNWFITYILLVAILFKYGGRKGRIALVLALVMVAAADQFGYRILKENIGRIRPCDALTDILTPHGKSGSYSFPSNHALNNFAVAVFFSSLYPQFTVVLFIVASLIAVSRVYLGVHYPSDIIGGAIIGSAIGFLFVELYRFIEKRYIKE